MFTPLPTDAVALTATTPSPTPSTPGGPQGSLVALADALRATVAVHLTLTDADGPDVDGPDADGPEVDGPDGIRGTVLTVTPRTSDEVVYVLRAAREHGVPVAVPVAGRAAGTPPDGAVRVSTAALDHLTILPVLARAHVGPGVRWTALVETAASFGLAPVPVHAPVTVAGDLVGTGADDRVGGPPDGVRAVDVVTPDGVLRRASPADSPDLFRALHVRGGSRAGTPGVVVALELDLVEVTAD